MKLPGFIALFLMAFFAYPQSEVFERGKILDSIPVKGSEVETYQLYLPEAYDPSVHSAIIFIFEPAARGTVGIKPLN